MTTLIGVMISLICPPFLLLSLYFMWKDCRNWRKYIWMYVMLFALLGFAYAPKPDSGDLVRYFSRLDIYKNYSLSDALSRFYYRESGETIWIWIASKLDLPGLLPGVAIGVVYGVATYITCDFAYRKDKEYLIKWILLGQFLYLPFNNIANNIFNVSAFALVLLAAYRDLIQRKRNIATLLLYVLPCFIQQAAFVLILVRILAIPVKKLKYVAVAIVALLPGVINLLYRNRGVFGGSSFLLGIIDRGNYYLNETADTEYAMRVQTVLWHRLNFVLNMLFAAVVIYAVVMLWRSIRENKLEIEKSENTFLSFIFLDAILAISCIAFSAPHYWRFNLVAQMAIGFIMVLLFDNDFKTQVWRYAFWAGGLGVLVIQGYHLLRSSVFISEWMLNFLFSSPLQIIYKLLVLAFSS